MTVTAPVTAELLAELRTAVGPDSVLTDVDVTASYARDMMPLAALLVLGAAGMAGASSTAAELPVHACVSQGLLGIGKGSIRVVNSHGSAAPAKAR